MNKEMYVSSTPHETRVALTEDDQLAEVFFERENEYTLAGSIYNGRVTRVLPGMQSAFVDIGLERDAFLYVSDFLEMGEEGEEFDEIPAGRGTVDLRPQGQQTAASAPTPIEEQDEEVEVADEEFAAPNENGVAEAAGESGPSAGDEGDSGEGARRWGGRRRRRGGRRGREEEQRVEKPSRPEPARAARADTAPPASESRAEPSATSGRRRDTPRFFCRASRFPNIAVARSSPRSRRSVRRRTLHLRLKIGATSRPRARSSA